MVLDEGSAQGKVDQMMIKRLLEQNRDLGTMVYGLRLICLYSSKQFWDKKKLLWKAKNASYKMSPYKVLSPFSILISILISILKLKKG